MLHTHSVYFLIRSLLGRWARCTLMKNPKLLTMYENVRCFPWSPPHAWLATVNWMVHAGGGPCASLIGPRYALSRFIASIPPKPLFGQRRWWRMPQRCICANFEGKYRTIAELKGHEVNIICKENYLFSPRVLHKEIPARFDFTLENTLFNI